MIVTTLEQYLKDHGLADDEAALYSTITERWIKARATIELGLGEDYSAEILTALAYQTTEHKETP